MARPPRVARCCLAAALAIAGAARAEVGADPLPGTQSLELRQPLDEVMVAGISRYALRALEGSQALRDQAWERNRTKPGGVRQANDERRARLATMIGAVDPRERPRGFEVVTTMGRSGVVAQSDEVEIYAVRWPALAGVWGEGLLLEPRKPAVARVIAIPDADWTPEMYAGLAAGADVPVPLPMRLAAAGVQTLVPVLISRDDSFSGSPLVAYTNQPHREFIYRQAFPLGRHVIGYEVEKVMAAIDQFALLDDSERASLPLGVAGVGEGGLVAMYAAAVDPRIEAALVAGYFQPRSGVWQEPIYRNLWGQLAEFGDAEIAGLIAPRHLVIEACDVPEVTGPPTQRPGRRGGAAPGRILNGSLEAVGTEFERARQFYRAADAEAHITLIASGDGAGPSGSPDALERFLKALGIESATVREPIQPKLSAGQVDPTERQRRQVEELTEFTQRLLRRSPAARDQFWAKADRSSVEAWGRSTEFYRDYVWEEMIGKLPPPDAPSNVRTRRVIDDPAYTGYEVAIDVYADVLAGGMLLVPNGLQPAEKRPLVVCQHGLEGVPLDTITRSGEGFKYYKAFADDLARRGYIVYAPQNPYRGGDRFRVLQRQSNPLKRSLFSYIIRQHERTLEWLATLPNVDPERIAFYGLSYGGKTAMRVPPLLAEHYALTICSGDFNDWMRKMVSVEDKYSYVFTGEYEMPEWNMGHVASYAELASLLTPRPFMVERGHDDGVAPDEWVAAEFARVRRHYDRLNLGDRVAIEFFNGPHTIHGVESYRFLQKWLNWPHEPAQGGH